MSYLKALLFFIVYFVFIWFLFDIIMHIVILLPLNLLDIFLKASEFRYYSQFYIFFNIISLITGILYLAIPAYVAYQAARLKVFQENTFLEALLIPVKTLFLKIPWSRKLAAVYDDNSRENNGNDGPSSPGSDTTSSY